MPRQMARHWRGHLASYSLRLAALRLRLAAAELRLEVHRATHSSPGSRGPEAKFRGRTDFEQEGSFRGAAQQIEAEGDLMAWALASMRPESLESERVGISSDTAGVKTNSFGATF
jgi:hypothetical protein